MPPQRSRPRDYENSVDPDAIHAEPEKLSGFGEKRTVIKDVELAELREKAELAEQLQQQLANQSSGLIVQEGGIVVEGFQFSPTGLIAPENFTEESWQQIGLLLLKLEGSINWLIGDWIVYGGQVGWGDLPQLAQTLGREVESLYKYAYVSRKVEFCIRMQDLSWGHHQLVAAQESQAAQEAALRHALENNLSVANFRKWLRGDQPALPAERQYNIAKMTDSVYEVAQKDLMQIPVREIRSALDTLKLIQRKNAEAEAKLLDALNKREK